MDSLEKGASINCSNYREDVEEENSDLRYDAAHVAKNLAFTVKEISISDHLPQAGNQVYLNITTLEAAQYCIELTERGYRIVATQYDTITNGNLVSGTSFESLNSLLETISPLYTSAFGEALISKLNVLQQQQEGEVNANENLSLK